MLTYKGTVTIEVNEFIELNKRAEEHEVLLEETDNLRYEIKSLRNALLQCTFRRDRMEYDTREEQTKLYNDKTPTPYFAYSGENIKILKRFGFTIDDMINYINSQWDAKDNGDLDGEDEEE